MRLTIIPLVVPTEQQYQDLYKIWPDQTQHTLKQMHDNGEQIYAARFNDRLLAAAKITIKNQEGIISDFCVREVTRRRGVGQYLLDEICQQHPTVTHWRFDFSPLAASDKMIMALFLTACGFIATNQTDEWEKRVTQS